ISNLWMETTHERWLEPTNSRVRLAPPPYSSYCIWDGPSYPRRAFSRSTLLRVLRPPGDVRAKRRRRRAAGRGTHGANAVARGVAQHALPPRAQRGELRRLPGSIAPSTGPDARPAAVC